MSINKMTPCARMSAKVPLPVFPISRGIRKRLLSSSTSLHITVPESPRYIEVPESLQPQKEPIQPVKGILPIPRQIVDKRREYKATPEWLEKTTKEPKRSIDLGRVPAHLRERTIYRQNMAEMRRNSLRQGVSELYSRKVKTERDFEMTRQRRVMRNIKAMHAPPRHDEVWTDISVSKAIRDALASKTQGHPYTAKEQAERKAEIDRRENERVEDRLQSLHNLYLHAKDFITDEKQLDDEINKIFGSEDVPITWGSNEGKSVWRLRAPLGTKDLVGADGLVTGRSGGDEQEKKINRMTKERLMRIAGQLTGGKIPIPDNLDDPKERLYY